MNELEKIFDMYASEKVTDSDEIIAADEKMGTYVKSMGLRKEEYTHLEELLVDTNIEYEKQGFMNGFRFAVKLLTC